MTDPLAPTPPPPPPPYRVPSMAEVRAMPWNGLTVASTFSGCGGSSLGYRMAGYRVAYASEFIPEARATYRANADPRTVIDPRDVRQVRPADVMDAAGVGPGELDLFDGSPPCASFSTAGSRSDGWGKVKKYSDTQQRTDDLFFEFTRLLAGVRPRAFVAENVAGLARGVAKGYFLTILAALKACGYRVAARILDAQWLGVPQSRNRLIFVGVRDDLGREPVHPRPLPHRYAVRDVMPWLGRLTVRTPPRELGGPRVDVAYDVCPTVMANGIGGVCHSQYSVLAVPGTARPEDGLDAGGQLRVGLSAPGQGVPPFADADGRTVEHRRLTIAECRRLCGFPDDFALTGTYRKQWERMGRAVPPVMMSHVAAAVAEHVLLPAAA